uniref:Uncharacterized protein n=1 Tax=Solanum tuberosum TaxID=4113 RepID=M1DHT4_SOLTU
MALTWQPSSQALRHAPLVVVVTPSRCPTRGQGPVAMPHWLGLHELKASRQAFPLVMVFTIGRELPREGEPNLRQSYGATASPPRVAPRSVVVTTSRQGCHRARQCLGKLGQPWPLPFFLGSCHFSWLVALILNPSWPTRL